MLAKHMGVSYRNKEVIINDGSTDTDVSIINYWISMNSQILLIKYISRMISGKL